MAEALAIKSKRARLSSNDCFCLVTTARHDDAVLRTGDRLVRKTAAEMGIEVHGVLWIIDLFFSYSIPDGHRFGTLSAP